MYVLLKNDSLEKYDVKMMRMYRQKLCIHPAMYQLHDLFHTLECFPCFPAGATLVLGRSRTPSSPIGSPLTNQRPVQIPGAL